MTEVSWQQGGLSLPAEHVGCQSQTIIPKVLVLIPLYNHIHIQDLTAFLSYFRQNHIPISLFAFLVITALEDINLKLRVFFTQIVLAMLPLFQVC